MTEGLMSNTLALGFLLFGFPSSFVFPFPFACQSMGFGRGLECAPTDHVNIMDPNHEVTWFKRAHRYNASFDTFVAKIGRLPTPVLVLKNPRGKLIFGQFESKLTKMKILEDIQTSNVE